jgi:threonine synthase
MRYISTRGKVAPMGFHQAVMEGLARDGGLLIPAEIPQVRDRLDEWETLSYQDLAFEIMRLFVDIPDEDLHRLIDRSYAVFRHPEIAPVTARGPVYLLELFYGPTLAFKDIALQLLGNLFEHLLGRSGANLNILGATSGDTGSAAIESVRGREHMTVFIMHPKGRIALLQEKQMTSVLARNVFNIAVEGTFDDCQDIMKTIFGDVAFKDRYSLGAVNSVNWARVMAQIVYYFSSGLDVMRRTGAAAVQFAVPTGNFGDILAGYYAQRMGLPVGRLILATNENDILSRFFTTGQYTADTVVPTLSPSMDIQVASNFERYLYYKVGGDAEALRALMDGFAESRQVRLPLEDGECVDPLFVAGVGDREATLTTIKKYHDQHDYILDPHTAVGVHVAEQHLSDSEPTICLATAHPAKFPAAIKEATGIEAGHEITDAVMHAETRCVTLPADTNAIRAYLEDHALI